jgi:predicted DCC family thiol-disulfide oxidoreductase YuxK
MCSDTQKNAPDILTIYFDGSCPLCLAEIHVLKSNNQQQLLNFVNLNDQNLIDAEINCQLAFEIIHAKLGSGELLKGSRVFEEAYKRSDLKLMKYLFSLKPFKILYGFFYIAFAKYRRQISRFIGPVLLKLAKYIYP